MNSKVTLVTGAAGRIGSVLAHGLSALGHRLRLTDLNNLPGKLPIGADFRQADLTDPANLPALCEGIDAVVHLAGHPNSSDWDVVQRLNVEPTRRLFEASIAAGARRLVFASSIHVTGFAPADAALAEDMAYAPDGPYGLSKVTGEMTLRYLCDRHRLSGVALRICTFKPRPTLARELRTWLSPDDMVRAAQAALTAEFEGYRSLWTLSANDDADVDRGSWDELGYAPRDNAAIYRADMIAAGVDVDQVSEWPYLGGAFASPPLARP